MKVLLWIILNSLIIGAAVTSAHATVIGVGAVTRPDIKIDNRSSLRVPGAPQNLVGFNINVNFQGTPPSASQQAIFNDAAGAWMSRITGYRGMMSLASVEINSTIEPDDGVGGTLGSAGPEIVDIQDEDGIPGGNRFALVTTGSMNFDSADIDNLEANGALRAVIEHEMGHVLGIGTLWDTGSFGGGFAGTQSHRISGSGQYTGPLGLAQYQAEFGQAGASFIPVEQGGGPGTADGHWDEVDLGGGLTGIQDGDGNDIRNELMTGWLNAPTFVSDFTIASLGDIGYTTIVAVPEPSAALLAFGGMLVFTRRRR